LKEVTFLKQNAEKWEMFEHQLFQKEKQNADDAANLFIEITNDLSYSKTHYPNSKTTQYLNSLASKVHHSIYQNKKI